MKEEPDIMQSIFEHRRNAVLWWFSKATNARLSALALSKPHEETIASIAKEHDYYGATSIALHEGFTREASIALELIIKAILAQKLEIKGENPAKIGVPATHDLPSLWKEAELPELSTQDQYRLLLCKTVLIWSGRYPTPKSKDAWQQESRAFEKVLGKTEKEGKFVFRKPINFDFEDFDRLFQMANNKLSTLIPINVIIDDK